MADVRLTVLAEVSVGDCDSAILGVEEAKEQVGNSGLSGAARADERNSPPWLEAQVEVSERRLLAGGVAGGNALQGNYGSVGRRRQRCRRVGHHRLSIGQLEDAPAGGERSGELASGRR